MKRRNINRTKKLDNRVIMRRFGERRNEIEKMDRFGCGTLFTTLDERGMDIIYRPLMTTIPLYPFFPWDFQLW